MGWTCTHRDRGEMTNLAWFKRELDSDRGHELLDLASAGFTLYGAYKVPDGRVVGLVILTYWTKAEFNYCWKEMDESQGPGYYDCPPRIFAMLTPHDGSENEWARDWRARCQDSIAQRAARPRLTKGSRVRFASAMRFTDGTEGDTFEYVKRNTFRKIVPLDFTPQLGEPWFYSGLYRIHGWAQLGYAVLTP